MSKRFITIWFRHLRTDWFTRRNTRLASLPFILTAADHGRMIVTDANAVAINEGITRGMTVADARAIVPSLIIEDDKPGINEKLLHGFAEWFIRYTPTVAIDLPDGLIMDVTGCAHLWGGERKYLLHILNRLHDFGYDVRAAMADTIGAAWALTHFHKNNAVVESNEQATVLLKLPVAALRIEQGVVERLNKLGLRQVHHIIAIPAKSLRRRFGNDLVLKLAQALGRETEIIDPIVPLQPYMERLPCLEPILTATGIEIALQRLLEAVCKRLKQEEKGLRHASFKCFRMDGKIITITIGTNGPSNRISHLFKLFESKLSEIEPDLGIELFLIEATGIEELNPLQESMWQGASGLEDVHLSELIDRITSRIGANHINRYLPDEHYWPERSVKPAVSFLEKPTTIWKEDKARPVQLLKKPEPVEVTSALPDYPPMVFRYKGIVHTIKKSDGPERIEPEWWLDEGPHRDYYAVEDEAGHRYWLFRSGHYNPDDSRQWFIHGFFA